MKIDQLVEQLAEAGVYLTVQGDRLLCKASNGALTPARRSLIADNKAELIAFLGQGLQAPGLAEPPLLAKGPGPAPLSPTQQRLWFIDQLNGSGASYTVPVTYRLHGPLDVDAFRRALARVIERHDSLRTVIELHDGEPRAVVRASAVEIPEPHNLDGIPSADWDADIHARLQTALLQPFDLANDVPIRVQLLRFAPQVHVLLLTMSHIATDGWSVENLLRELSVLYTAFAAGNADPLPPPVLQYADYALWQKQWLQGERLQRELDHWRKQLAGAPVVHSLPLDRTRSSHGAHAGGSWRQQLPAALHRELLELGRVHGTTLFMTLQAALAVLLARWGGNPDIVIGTPVANRPRDELAPLIGFFANTLALRTDLSDNPPFSEVLRRVKVAALDAYSHQHLPFELLVEDLNPPRSLGLAPLVQVMFSLLDIDEDAALNLPGIVSRAIIPDACNAKFDLNLSFNATADGLNGCWDYSRDLFDTDTIASMGAAFAVLLQGIVTDPTQCIGQFPLLDDAERQRVLALGNDTVFHCPDDQCLHQLVEQQVRRRPDAIAISQEGELLSYGQLNTQANRLAHHLRTLGVGPDVPVGIAMERSPTQIVALLAIMKAGGAYVPMEPDYPAPRLQHLLADSAPAVLITGGGVSASLKDALAGMAPAERPRVLDVVADAASWVNGCTDNPSPSKFGLTASNLAYIIYTSGSTGHPKGAMNEHRSVVNRILWLCDTYPLGESDHFLQKTPLGFDVSVREIFVTLLAGARLVLARPEGHKDASYLVELIQRENITITGFVPSMLQVFLEHPRVVDCRSIRHMFCGGETLSGTLVRRCRELLPQARLHNLYGPTEAAISVTVWDCPDGPVPGIIPIGRPSGNTRIYILDALDRPVPRGMRGEIHIAGRQVARGYLNRPELTAERFVEEPFQQGKDARMYRSGDLGRQLADGSIGYLGRNDFQVKIRGQRVELGEIEAQLLACDEVRQVIVLAQGDDHGQLRLVAYVVPTGNHGDETKLLESLRFHAQAQLPAHMLPAAYVVLSQLPVTHNGKLDTRALPAPDISAIAGTGYVPPSTAIEHQLASVWADLLHMERVGVSSNFFDLGGHSLLLTRLHNRLQAHYGLELALRQLFEAQTVREQASLIESAQRQPDAMALPFPVPRPQGAPEVLSFAQRRLWLIDQIGDAGAVYNIPCALRLVGPLQPKLLHRALETIVRRHAVLRTPLVSVDGEAQPRRRNNVELALPLHDLGALEPAARAANVRRRVDAEAARPFNLAADLLLRAQLLRLAGDEHILLLTLHHIAADGWSMVVLLQELAELYDADAEGRTAALPPLSLQYSDYAHWQQQWLRGERLETQLQYWQDQLAALPVVHNLPLDYARPDTQRYRGAMHRQRLESTLLVELKHLARTHDATLFMTMQAAFAVLLARWSGDTDIVVGTPIANRRHEELTPLIGFFVNTLVLRNDLSANPRFSDALTEARKMALDAFQHQDLPFEMLVDRLRPQRSLSHGPLFQVMFALNNNDAAVVSFGGLDIADVAGESHYAKFDLTLSVRETPDGLEAYWDYNRDLFRADTVSRIAASFEALLRGIVANPEQRIQQLPLRAADDRPPEQTVGPRHALTSVAGAHVLFEARAIAMPETIAVHDGQHHISYATLNRRANRVAHALRALDVGPDRRVAIHVERSIDNFVGVLAVLKAGGAYVPLDPAHPAERLARMLADSGALVLLTQTGLRDALAERDIPRLMLDDEVSFETYASSNPVVPELQQQHMAYVIYTSGSTGAPKGVMVEHAALLNMVEDSARLFGDDKPIEAAWWSSFGFDVSVFEMFFALAMGATSHIVPEELRTDAAAYVQWLTERRITQAAFPPFIVRGLRECSDARIAALSLRRLMTGIEPLQENELCRLRRLLPELVIVNSYGPTETTVYSTYYTDIRDLRRNAPIGRPTANTSIHVLDGAMQPVPAGVVGEIYIAGTGVARGYLNQPELTAARFLQDESGERMYKTGDLGRWLPEGQLEFRGRSDLQFKLNGVRIEPGEIEAVLCTYPGVREAVVVVRADHGPDNKQLVAYLTSRDGSRVPVDSLREYLAQRLPPYMLPAAYVTIDELPLTVNGKLAARALPVPELHAYTAAAYVPPASALERQLAAIWQGLLQHEQISVTANFFDLGGHSLNAVRLMSGIREATGKALPISTLFKAPTIRALAAQIENHEATADESFVTLRGEGSTRPLFVFHAAGGDVLCYQPLLQYLAPDMPVHGFHRRELPNQRVPMFLSVEQLADEYVSRMLEQQPDGGFYLAGWSSGGLLALEVAARLEKLGRTVAVVMLIDTMLATGTDLPAQFHEVGLPELARLSPQAACDLMREFEPTLPEVTQQDGVLHVSAADYFNYLVAANQIGLDFHRPDFHLASRVHYFGCAFNRNLKTEEQRIAEIQALVEKPISRESFEATHFSIMEEPDVAELGCAMASMINRCRKEEAMSTLAPPPPATDFLRETVA